MTKLEAAFKAFERYWKANHPTRKYPRKIWLKRSDLWGDPGYEQPAVHFDWMDFLAGWVAAEEYDLRLRRKR